MVGTIRLAQAAEGFDASDPPGRGIDEGLEEGNGLALEHERILINGNAGCERKGLSHAIRVPDKRTAPWGAVGR
ncbi:hypothetical protein thsps117_07200 [Pseudomonas sp. No.117]